jgi:hypothetical protein
MHAPQPAGGSKATTGSRRQSWVGGQWTLNLAGTSGVGLMRTLQTQLAHACRRDARTHLSLRVSQLARGARSWDAGACTHAGARAKRPFTCGCLLRKDPARTKARVACRKGVKYARTKVRIVCRRTPPKTARLASHSPPLACSRPHTPAEAAAAAAAAAAREAAA